ncbi:MAG: hypothetical protein RSD94_11580 [Acinetobacter sp.]
MKVILWMSALSTAFWVGLHFGVGAFISRFLPARLFDFHRPFYRPRLLQLLEKIRMRGK